MNFEGHWRIVEMELWDQDAIDLLGPAFVEVTTSGQGRFRFIAVEGWMDIREVTRGGRAGIEFSWEGTDELRLGQRPRLGNAVARRLAGGPDLPPHGRRLMVPSGAGDGLSTFVTGVALFWTSLPACLMS